VSTRPGEFTTIIKLLRTRLASSGNDRRTGAQQQHVMRSARALSQGLRLSVQVRDQAIFFYSYLPIREYPTLHSPVSRWAATHQGIGVRKGRWIETHSIFVTHRLPRPQRHRRAAHVNPRVARVLSEAVSWASQAAVLLAVSRVHCAQTFSQNQACPPRADDFQGPCRWRC
jgi:hypothetical protein